MTRDTAVVRTNFKVLHIIAGLTDGGAEAVLYRLCASDSTGEHSVVSLTDEGKYGPLLREAGVPVFSLGLRSGRISLGAVLELWRLLRAQRPSVVQTWMYHADLIGGLVARLASVGPVVWGVHHTTLEPGKSKRSTIWIARACARLSWRVPSAIIFCAKAAAQVHEVLGYDASKFFVVNNGYDSAEFYPDAALGMGVREELGIPGGARLLGMVGRFNPQKDHENLLNALSELDALGEEFYCLLVGQGVDRNNHKLMNWIADRGLNGRVLPLGPRRDITAVMNALDLHVLSSAYGEAFPNVLAEAMACGTPCVSTDLGDASVIVGDTGWIVPAKDSGALADALVEALNCQVDLESWRLRQEEARKRIDGKFSTSVMLEGYRRAWGAVGSG